MEKGFSSLIRNTILLVVIALLLQSCSFFINDEPLRFQNIELKVLKSEVVDFQLDKPWEDAMIGYINILKKDSTYHLWYETFNSDSKYFSDPSFNGFLNYAYSDDGYEWKKPDINKREYLGYDNNILFYNNFKENGGIHGVHVYKDINNGNFKMIYSALQNKSHNSAIYYRDSKDGKAWSNRTKVVQRHSDTQSIIINDTPKHLYYRYWESNSDGKKYRQIGYSLIGSYFQVITSEKIDLINKPDADYIHFYTNSARKVLGDTILMFPSIFDEENNSMSIVPMFSAKGNYKSFKMLPEISFGGINFKTIYVAPQNIDYNESNNTFWIYYSFYDHGHDNWRNRDDKFVGQIGRSQIQLIVN